LWFVLCILDITAVSSAVKILDIVGKLVENASFELRKTAAAETYLDKDATSNHLATQNSNRSFIFFSTRTATMTGDKMLIKTITLRNCTRTKQHQQ